MIRLRLRIPNSPVPVTLELFDSAVFDDLLDQVAEKSGLEKGSFKLNAGYPPSSLSAEGSSRLCDSVQSGETLSVIKNDHVGHQAVAESPLPKEKAKKKESRASSGIAAGGGARFSTGSAGGEAGAGRASSSSGLLPPSASASSSGDRGSGVRSLGGGAGGGGAGSNVRTLHDSARGGGGRRSSTGEGKKGRAARSGEDGFSNEADLSTHLVEMMSRPVAALGARDKALRKAFGCALRRSEKSTAALHRVSAGLGGKYEIKMVEGQGTPKFQVTYRVDKHDVVETYTAFPKLLIGLVIKNVVEGDDEAAKKNLVARDMAEAQPMVFWNILRIFGGDFEKGMRELAPSLDLQKLAVRERPLSQKAKDNLEQKRRLEEEKTAAKEAREQKKQKKENKNKTCNGHAAAGEASQLPDEGGTLSSSSSSSSGGVLRDSGHEAQPQREAGEEKDEAEPMTIDSDAEGS